MRRVLAAVLLSLPIVASASASGNVTLEWEAPPECPDRALVEAKITSSIGGAQGVVSAEAKVTRVGDAYRLHVVTLADGVRGERTIDDPSCAALADATALIVALAVDPTLGGGATPTASVPAPSASAAPSAAPSGSAAPATPKPPPKPPASAVVRPPPAPPPRVAAFVGIAAIAGPLPSPALALSGGLGVLRGPLRVEIDARWAPGADRSVQTRAGAGGTFDLLAAALGAHYALLRGPIELGPRVGLEAGVLRGRAFGVEIPLQGRSAWIAGEAGVTSFVRSGPLALRADLSAIVPFLRPEFVIEGLGPVFRPAALGGRFSVGVELRF